MEGMNGKHKQLLLASLLAVILLGSSVLAPSFSVYATPDDNHKKGKKDPDKDGDKDNKSCIKKNGKYVHDFGSKYSHFKVKCDNDFDNHSGATLTPTEQMITNLIETTDQKDIKKGFNHELDGKLVEALNNLLKHNPNPDNAKQKLNEYIHMINQGERQHKISTADGSQLISMAQAIIAVL